MRPLLQSVFSGKPLFDKKRLLLPDMLRGFSVISMVLFHGMWDAVWLYGLNAPWYNKLPGYIWQQSICWTFILISGFSLHFDRKPFRRGGMILAVSFLITLVTVLFMPEERIVFGVLTLHGTAVLITAAAEPLLKKIPVPAGAAASFLIFLILRDVNEGWLGFETILLGQLPKQLYHGLFMTFLGFTDPGFYSTDYFSLLPWLFLFLTGWFLHPLCINTLKKAEEKRRERNHGEESRAFRFIAVPFLFAGRNAFIIYILHQPLIMLFFTIVNF